MSSIWFIQYQERIDSISLAIQSENRINPPVVGKDKIWTPDIDVVNRIHGFSYQDENLHKCTITHHVSFVSIMLSHHLLRNRFFLLHNHFSPKIFRDLYRTHEIIVFELIFTPSSIIIHMIHKDQGKILGQSEAELLANQKRIFKIFQNLSKLYTGIIK